jgi:hypothetical protein
MRQPHGLCASWSRLAQPSGIRARCAANASARWRAGSDDVLAALAVSEPRLSKLKRETIVRYSEAIWAEAELSLYGETLASVTPALSVYPVGQKVRRHTIPERNGCFWASKR